MDHEVHFSVSKRTPRAVASSFTLLPSFVFVILNANCFCCCSMQCSEKITLTRITGCRERERASAVKRWLVEIQEKHREWGAGLKLRGGGSGNLTLSCIVENPEEWGEASRKKWKGHAQGVTDFHHALKTQFSCDVSKVQYLDADVGEFVDLDEGTAWADFNSQSKKHVRIVKEPGKELEVSPSQPPSEEGDSSEYQGTGVKNVGRGSVQVQAFVVDGKALGEDDVTASAQDGANPDQVRPRSNPHPCSATVSCPFAADAASAAIRVVSQPMPRLARSCCTSAALTAAARGVVCRAAKERRMRRKRRACGCESGSGRCWS